MPMAAKGLAKLTEEIGELGQVVGKRLAYYTTNEHPDGGEPLDDRMVKEMGDVMAASRFVANKLELDAFSIDFQSDHTFQFWAQTNDKKPIPGKGLALLAMALGDFNLSVGAALAQAITGATPLKDAGFTRTMGIARGTIAFVAYAFGLSTEAIQRRADKKLALFELWDSNPHNNHHAVDGDRE